MNHIGDTHLSTFYECQACLWVSNIELVEEWVKRQQGNAKLTSNLLKELESMQAIASGKNT